MIAYETNNKYLMHFNKNHDNLGRFAKGHGSKRAMNKELDRLSRKKKDLEDSARADGSDKAYKKDINNVNKSVESIKKEAKKRGYSIGETSINETSMKQKAKIGAAVASAIMPLFAVSGFLYTGNPKVAAGAAAVGALTSMAFASAQGKEYDDGAGKFKNRKIKSYRVK